jgi:hypothetical protein
MFNDCIIFAVNYVVRFCYFRRREQVMGFLRDRQHLSDARAVEMKVKQGLPVSIFQNFLLKGNVCYSVKQIDVWAKEGNQLVSMQEFRHYNACWRLLQEFIDGTMFITPTYTELICYGIATVGVLGNTIHHCGTFLRQMVNRRPVVLYLDAVQTCVLRLRGFSEHYVLKSFEEIFENYQMIRLYKLERRSITNKM